MPVQQLGTQDIYDPQKKMTNLLPNAPPLPENAGAEAKLKI